MFKLKITLDDGKVFTVDRDSDVAFELKKAFYGKLEEPYYEVRGKNNSIYAKNIIELEDIFVQVKEDVKESNVYYRVYYGYSEYFSIPETELVKAKYKQVIGGDELYSYGGYSIQSKLILKIIPDVNKILGWNDDYVPKGEFIKEAQEEERKHMLLLKEADMLISHCIRSGTVNNLLLSLPVQEIQNLSNYKLLN